MNPRQKIFTFSLLSLSLFCLLALCQPDYGIEEVNDEEFWVYKAFQHNKYDIIAFGDSRVYRGISPQHLSSGTRLSAFNLGFSSGGMSEPLFDLVDQSISLDRTPVIIVGITPHSLTPTGLENKQLRGVLEKHDKREMAIKYKTAAVTRLFQPFKLSDVFKDTLSAEFDEYNTYYRNGWTASHSAVDDPTRTLSIYRKNLAGNEVSEDALRDMSIRVKKWSNKGIHVFAFRIPSTKAMESLEDSLTGFNVDTVRLILKNSGATWLTFDSEDYRSYDGSHLHFESAIQFSGDLAAIIKKEIQ